MHFEAQGAGRRLTSGRDMATGLCSKCVTVDKSSSQGDDRRERPWGVEVGSDFSKWAREVEVERERWRWRCGPAEGPLKQF